MINAAAPAAKHRQTTATFAHHHSISFLEVQQHGDDSGLTNGSSNRTYSPAPIDSEAAMISVPDAVQGARNEIRVFEAKSEGKWSADDRKPRSATVGVDWVDWIDRRRERFHLARLLERKGFC